MKTFEIEITRNNLTPAEFLRYVRNRVDAKGGAMFRSDLDTAYFAAGNDLNFDIKRTAEEAAETTNGCIRELNVSRPYEMQTFCAWIDGTKYNEICEFSFDDEKTGHGYYYLINTYAEDNAQPAQDAETETETENQTDAENAAEGTQNENKGEGTMEKYDYKKSMKNDIREYIEDHYTAEEIRECMEDRMKWEEELTDDLWITDSVTGNASGSYTFNTHKAAEYICTNLDLLAEAAHELGNGSIDVLHDGAESCDVTIRCYLLYSMISAVLDEIENEIWEE